MLCISLTWIWRARCAPKALRWKAALALWLLAAGSLAAAQSVRLAWDANTEPDLAGYIVHYGGIRRSYTNAIDVGNVTTAAVSNLLDGATYYFAVTAYNTSGLESDFSNEVLFTGTKPTATILSWPNPAGIIYGLALGAAQLNAQANVPGTFVYSPGPGTVLNAGTGQALSVGFTPADLTQYSAVSTNTRLDVAKAALTVTANNVSRMQGLPNPTFTASFSGWVNGDSASVLTHSVVFSTPAELTSTAGVYSIIPSGAAAANYSPLYVDGLLTVTAAPVSTTLLRFTNSTAMSIPDQGPSTPYPSHISVSGLAGPITKVSATVTGLQHTFPADLGLLLVGPTGQNVVLMAHAFQPITAQTAPATLTFDDDATAAAPQKGTLLSGAYKPASYAASIIYSAPAPNGAHGNSLAAFNGSNPTGDWSLYVMDSAPPDHGSIVGGWMLEISTASTNAPPVPVSLTNALAISIPDHGPGSPYPSTITVAGMPGLISKVTATVRGFSHTWPQDAGLRLVSPEGQKTVLMSHAGGTASATPQNATLTFDDAAVQALPNTAAIVSGTFKPATYGLPKVYPSPAPPGPYASAMSALAGINPNGTWSLFVIDSDPGDQGSISGGWSLQLQTTNAAGAIQLLTLRNQFNPQPTPAETAVERTDDSVPIRIVSVNPIGDPLQITLLGRIGTAFVVECSPDLLVWQPVHAGVLAVSPLVISHAAATSSNQRFYRVRTVPSSALR